MEPLNGTPNLQPITAESLYARAHLGTADQRIAAALDGLKQLSQGWTERLSPLPVHRLLSQKLPIPEGRKQHEGILLQLAKAGISEFAQEASKPEELTVHHARFWQFMSLRFFPSNPQGLMQFQMELSVILEELGRMAAPQKPLLQLAGG